MIRSWALLVAVLVLLGRSSVSDAEIYRWTDDRGIANYTEGLDSVPQKYRATAVPIGLRNAPPAPPAPAGRPTAAGGPGASTQFTFAPGKEIVVAARLNGTTSIKLLLDTGAERTVISPRVLAAAGVSLTTGQAMQMRGATGTASVSTAQLASLEVGQARVERLAVISHDIEQDGMDGLLGRDFLDQFKVAIDNKDGVVTLSPK